jgi:hypothetical protein
VICGLVVVPQPWQKHLYGISEVNADRRDVSAVYWQTPADRGMGVRKYEEVMLNVDARTQRIHEKPCGQLPWNTDDH